MWRVASSWVMKKTLHKMEAMESRHDDNPPCRNSGNRTCGLKQHQVWKRAITCWRGEQACEQT
jgi:hypothetical protein